MQSPTKLIESIDFRIEETLDTLAELNKIELETYDTLRDMSTIIAQMIDALEIALKSNSFDSLAS